DRPGGRDPRLLGAARAGSDRGPTSAGRRHQHRPGPASQVAHHRGRAGAVSRRLRRQPAMTAEKPHGEHVGHRWRTATPEGDWWPDRDTDPTPTPTTDPPPRLPRGVRDNLED